jgi:hypothetical protein
MAIRTDFTIDWDVSPRVILIDAPSTEVSMQDLLDTLRTEECKASNMDNPPIVSAAGKEELGGGVQVGLTVTLLNAVLGFEARGGPTWVQCNASGGNLVSVDVNGTPIPPIYPTMYTQVVITASSSATLQGLDTMCTEVAEAVWAYEGP